jgi:S1-C subfamily serine protease
MCRVPRPSSPSSAARRGRSRPLQAHARAAAWPIAALAVALTVAPAAPASAQNTLSALQTDVDQIARRARPAVVTVFAVNVDIPSTSSPVANANVPPPRVHTRVGSGVAVGEDLILTTASVAMESERTLVSTANGLQVEATVVGVDPVFNVALLRVPTLRLPYLKFADPAHAARVGDWVVSLGTSYNTQPTQSLGNVAQRHREPGQSLLQLTNTVYPGNSGAAALNIRGELIGLVQGELGAPGPAESGDDDRRAGAASFAMPVETLRPVFESLKRSGHVEHGYLGVSTLAASLESDREGGPSTPIGALVEGIVSGGPADRLGLRPGDLIVAFDNERVETPEQLARWVLATAPGKSVTLVWVRRDTEHHGQLTLGTSPDRVPQWLAGAAAPQDTPRKVAELTREIQRLRQQMDRLKTGDSDR